MSSSVREMHPIRESFKSYWTDIELSLRMNATTGPSSQPSISIHTIHLMPSYRQRKTIPWFIWVRPGGILGNFWKRKVVQRSLNVSIGCRSTMSTSKPPISMPDTIWWRSWDAFRRVKKQSCSWSLAMIWPKWKKYLATQPHIIAHLSTKDIGKSTAIFRSAWRMASS